MKEPEFGVWDRAEQETLIHQRQESAAWSSRENIILEEVTGILGKALDLLWVEM